MAVEINTARFLLKARERGVSFKNTLTIGRQNFYVFPADQARLAREFRLQNAPPVPPGGYVEPFFQNCLGAENVSSMDVSPYESATHIHDMNYPVGEEFKNRYDVVFDAGSFEHILNFPVALKSAMEMVKVGGSILIQTPANNYFGHGFFQFSPELFYRVFSAENGFKVEQMVVVEHFFPAHFFRAPWHAVRDPDEARSRVQLVNNRPTLLLIHARKVAQKEIFARYPQQSDYVTTWGGVDPAQAVAPPPPRFAKARHWLRDKAVRIPLKFVGFLFLQYLANSHNKPALRNRKFFERLK